MNFGGTTRTVNATARNSILNASVAIFAVVASASALGQLDTSRVASDLSLVVDGDSEILVMPIITEDVQDDVVTYDLGAGEVRFDTGVISPEYDEPLFCFDLGTPSSAVKLEVLDPNGHVIIDQFDLKDPLAYSLESPLTLTLDPASDQQCFYRSSQDVFGLFGASASNGSEPPPGLIFSDRLEVDRALGLEYQGLPDFVTPGQTFSHDLIVTNTGTGDLQATALQELFPENLGVYSAALTGTTWTCSATGDAVCPASSGTGPLRFNEMNAGGIDLTVGDSLTFTIERTVDADSITGETIRLHAGTVADPVATGAAFAVAEAQMTVIGESAGLNVASSSATADSAATSADATDDAQITVTVLDDSQNPVPGETVTLDDAGGLTVTSANSGTSDASGQVNFTATAEDADDYTISFASGSLSGSGVVTILAGEPGAFFMQTSVPSAVADGQAEVEVLVLVEDQFDNAVSMASVEVVDNDGLASLPVEEFTDIAGIATFTATSTTVGTYEPSFSVSGVVGSSSATVSFEPGAPDDLEFTLQPPDPVIADTEFDVSLDVVDAEGNLVADDDQTFVTLNLQQGGGTVRNLTSGNVTDGQVTFTIDSLGPSDIGSDYRIQAVASGTGFFGANSTTFDIVAP